jgi:hypothetical protein
MQWPWPLAQHRHAVQAVERVVLLAGKDKQPGNEKGQAWHLELTGGLGEVERTGR